eukprot:scaffold2450_cov401-Prasinococcus_capsulatus_cf.AAC.1
MTPALCRPTCLGVLGAAIALTPSAAASAWAVPPRAVVVPCLSRMRQWARWRSQGCRRCTERRPGAHMCTLALSAERAHSQSAEPS